MSQTINNYVDANIVAGKLTTPGYVCGVAGYRAISVFTPANGDLAGSIYRLFRIPSDAIILSLSMFNAAITGATSVNIGLYDVLSFDGVGAIIGTGDQFMTATDISAGTAVTSTRRDCLTNLSIANRNQALWSIVGETQAQPKRAAFDIAMTFTAKTTVGTGAVAVYLEYLRGN